MGKIKDITGQIFGRLTAIKFAGLNKHKEALWECECSCGNIVTVIVVGYSLRNGNTKSCGCLNKESVTKHGHSKRSTGITSTYHSWADMKYRCLNPNSSDYPDYGGRGIKVCDRWIDFNNFLEDMGEMPEGYSIERISVNGDYEPDNCIWLPRPLQLRNTRRTILNEKIVKEARQRYSNGERVCDLAREYGVTQENLGQAIRGITWKDIA